MKRGKQELEIFSVQPLVAFDDMSSIDRNGGKANDPLGNKNSSLMKEMELRN